MASSSKGFGHALLCASKNIATGAHGPANQNRLSSQLWMQASINSPRKSLKKLALNKSLRGTTSPEKEVSRPPAVRDSGERTALKDADQQLKRLASS